MTLEEWLLEYPARMYTVYTRWVPEDDEYMAYCVEMPSVGTGNERVDRAVEKAYRLIEEAIGLYFDQDAEPPKPQPHFIEAAISQRTLQLMKKCQDELP